MLSLTITEVYNGYIITGATSKDKPVTTRVAETSQSLLEAVAMFASERKQEKV